MKSHTKGKRKSRDHPPMTQGFKRPKRDLSNFECFTCHKLGHIAINCPMKEERIKKMTMLEAHAAEESDQEVEDE